MPEVNPFVAESERGRGERVCPGSRRARGQATAISQPVEMHFGILTTGRVVVLNASWISALHMCN